MQWTFIPVSSAEMKFDQASKPFSAMVAAFGSIVSDQAIYRLAIMRGRIDWLYVACSLSASNPSDQVPAAESTRTDFTQGTEILSPLFVPEIILTFLAQVLS